jgi:hypothetical protein
MWDQLPAVRQQSIITEVRQALLEMKAAAEGTENPAQRPGQRYRRHVQFAEGEVRELPVGVFNSARRARSDAAWAALAESGRRIQEQRKGQR